LLLAFGDAFPASLGFLKMFHFLTLEGCKRKPGSAGRLAGQGASQDLPMSAIWTKERLHDLIATELKGVRFIAVSNREPYIHRYHSGSIECIEPASGLATAIDPIMRASEGVWIAHGSGDADREAVDSRDHVAVPPEDPSYTLRRVWLDKQMEEGYYYGLANGGLWPLCHIAFQRPTFELKDWECYRRANHVFAEAVLEEAGDGPAFVFIQDYHFGLLPRMLKNRNPKLIVSQFWHIPWPNRETFRAFPWKDELLDGMLGNDLLGFHLRYHCTNFLHAIDRGIEALVDTEHFNVTRGGKVTMVRPFPISIDFDQHNVEADGPEVKREMARWIAQFGGKPEFLGVGIDRIDYTKGIPDRLRALDLFLEQNPQYLGRLTFVQIGVPSRVRLGQYRDLNLELDRQVKELNTKWGNDSWRPVIFFKSHHPQVQLMALHRLADFCIVSSLHDGMNLVAKEFVASRIDNDGVLILSSFTGAARELVDALLVNPFAVDEIAGAIRRALTMTAGERRKRMCRLRAAVAENNIYHWAGGVLSTLLKLDFREADDAPEPAEISEGAAV
jgi:trehalose-6-phosphate synthase